MKLANLWSVAIAEIRSCRRLVRTWVFVVLATVGCVSQWLNLGMTHARISFNDPSAGLQAPQYLIAHLGSNYVIWFCLGIIFLAFDIRFRDIRDRIVEVINCKPISNLELLSGRLMGIVLLLGSTVFIVVTLLSVVGFAATASGAYFQGFIEPVSLIAFLVWDIVPNLTLWGSLTILLAVLVRIRLVVVLVVLVLLGIYAYVNIGLPYSLSSVFSLNSGTNVMPSELTPQLVTTTIFVNRVATMLLAFAFLALSASLHSRQTSSTNRLQVATTGSLSLVFGILGFLILVLGVKTDQAQSEKWASIHRELQGSGSTNIDRISGRVVIAPGSFVELDLSLVLRSDSNATEDTWLLSLNPGYRIQHVAMNGEKIVDVPFENGLLRLPRNPNDSEPVEVHVVAKGKPNPKFAYLDSKLDWSQENMFQVRELNKLGRKSYIFHPEYVVMMPGVSWFPSSGSAYGNNTWDADPQDFFELDVEVTVPKGWSLAGPGTCELVTQGKKTTYRFSPQRPIPQFALVGSNFERRAITVAGIEFELLLSKKHRRNLRVFEDIGPALKPWIEEKLSILARSGLEYPYGTLFFVEVPNTLRVYGGGWRMASVYTQPGIQMLRETGFPLARFDNALPRHTSDVDVSAEQIGNHQLNLLNRFFERDSHGGNPLDHISLNLVNYQTMPVGPGAIAMKYVVDELVTNLTTNSVRYFSVYRGQSFLESLMLDLQSNPLLGLVAPSYGQRMRLAFTSRNSVWDRTTDTSLSEMDFSEDPESAYHVLLLKGNAIADTVTDESNREIVADFLSELVQEFQGHFYTKEQFFETALKVGLDFGALAGDWLDGKGLAGFIATNPKTERLQNSESGESVYQTSFVLRNNEPVPGKVDISYVPLINVGTREQSRPLKSMFVGGNTSLQIAFLSELPVGRVMVQPLFALNRRSISLVLPELNSYEPTQSPELPQVKVVDWTPPYANSIVVDDLDAGFSIVTHETEDERETPGWIRYLTGGLQGGFETEFDQGLPTTAVATFLSGRQYPWIRTSSAGSFGRYRHTHATKLSTSSEDLAVFSATLSTPGRWQLEFHNPSTIAFSHSGFQFSTSFSLGTGNRTTVEPDANDGEVRDSDRETETSSKEPMEETTEPRVVHLEIHYDDVITPVKLDLRMSPNGWVQLGQFDILGPDVKVLVTGGTPGSVIADAVKWTAIQNQ